MWRMWADVLPRPCAAYQSMDGLPMPKADCSGSEGCQTTENGTTMSVTIGSGVPLAVGWERSQSVSKTECERYLARNPDGTRARWAQIWTGQWINVD